MNSLKLFIKGARPLDWLGMGVTAAMFSSGGYLLGTNRVLEGFLLVMASIVMPIVVYICVKGERS